MQLNPNYDQTLTVFHRNREKIWEKSIIENCYFRKGCISTVDAAGRETLRDTATARISDLNVELSKGDLIVRGIIPEVLNDESPYTVSELLEKYAPDAFRVAGVSDNSRSLGQHIKAVG